MFATEIHASWVAAPLNGHNKYAHPSARIVGRYGDKPRNTSGTVGPVARVGGRHRPPTHGVPLPHEQEQCVRTYRESHNHRCSGYHTHDQENSYGHSPMMNSSLSYPDSPTNNHRHHLLPRGADRVCGDHSTCRMTLGRVGLGVVATFRYSIVTGPRAGYCAMPRCVGTIRFVPERPTSTRKAPTRTTPI